jgi:hypothetical protein
MTSNTWAMMLGIAMQALLFHAMPRFSRPDIPFAVLVGDTGSGILHLWCSRPSASWLKRRRSRSWRWCWPTRS